MALVVRQVLIGLDVGTTAAKAVAFDLAAPWTTVALREYPLVEPQPGWQVQDPDRILTAMLSALTEVVAAAGPCQVIALSVSTAMHGLIALDADLRPLTPLLTWADARAVGEARALRGSGQAAELHRRTATPVHPMSPLTKLMWFARHDASTFAAARWWVGLKDYVLLHLTGSLVTELSSASATGLLASASRQWDDDALRVAGVRADQLPPVLSPTASLPLSADVARQVGLVSGTPVVLGAADGPLGNLGVGAIAPGVAGLSIGTSGAVRMVVPEPVVDEARTLFCYALTESAWVVGGAVSNGGIVVRWTQETLAPELAATADGLLGDEAVLALAAQVPAGCDGLVMLPYLLSERAPLWDPTIAGAYLGLRREHTRGHLVRAAVEGVALQLSTILVQLDRLAPVTSVRATGGVFRSPLWRHVVASMLERPVHVVGAADGTARGAACLALLALGRARTLEEAVAALPTSAEGADVELVMPDPADVTAYRGTRAAVPELARSLAAVADLFAPSG